MQQERLLIASQSTAVGWSPIYGLLQWSGHLKSGSGDLLAGRLMLVPTWSSASTSLNNIDA